jgi:hypothetical protein
MKINPGNPLLLPKPDRDMLMYLNGRGEFSVDYEIAFERHLRKPEFGLLGKLSLWYPGYIDRGLLKSA